MVVNQWLFLHEGSVTRPGRPPIAFVNTAHRSHFGLVKASRPEYLRFFPAPSALVWNRLVEQLYPPSDDTT